jgi:RHS repeat-associated protein
VTYTASSVTAFDSAFDLPTVAFDAYHHETDTAYDRILGLPSSVTDCNGEQVTTQYDPLGRKTKVRDLLKSLDSDTTYAWTVTSASDWTNTQTVTPPPQCGGLTVSSVYAVRSTSHPSSLTTTYLQPPVTTYYDELGRAIRTIKEGFAGKIWTDTIYNNLGQVVATSLPYLSSTAPLWTTTTYDALGRVATTLAPNQTSTTNVYKGRITQATIVAPGVSWGTQTNSTLVDAKGRTVAVWNADNQPVLTVISGSDVASTADPGTASVAYALDGFGRMRKTTLKGQNQAVIANYDALGRQIELNDPDKGDWIYVNSSLGQVLKQTDANQNVTTSKFDQLGRPLVRTTAEANSGPVETANWYYYDTAANVGSYPNLVDSVNQGWIGAQAREESVTVGALGYVDLGTKSTHYYDSLGRPHIDISMIDGKYFYTTTDYEPSTSRVTQVHHYWRPPAHESPTDLPYLWSDFGYNYSYDNNSYLLSLTDSANRIWWDQPVYDYLDRVVSVRKGSGLTTLRTYRATDGQLTNISTGSLQNLSFNYDGVGNLTYRSDGTHSETLGYDLVNRLTSSSITGSITYTDSLGSTTSSNGNILSKNDVSGNPVASYVYGGSRPHAVTSVIASGTPVNIDYDANGNMTTRTSGGHTWSTKWAGFDKPRWLADVGPSGTNGSEFHYNAARSRVMHLDFKAMSGGAPSQYSLKRIYAWGGTGEIDYTSGAVPQSWALNKIRIYVPGPDGVIGAMEFMPSAPFAQAASALVYHYDHLGSIQSVTPYGVGATPQLDGTGKPALYAYDPWGQRRDPANTTWLGSPSTTDAGGATSVTPRGFTGHEMLDNIGLVHMNGRIYDPLLGRFLSADIVVQNPGDLQSYNRYSYVRNNPLSATDPSGFIGETLVVPFIAEKFAEFAVGLEAPAAALTGAAVVGVVADSFQTAGLRTAGGSNPPGISTINAMISQNMEAARRFGNQPQGANSQAASNAASTQKQPAEQPSEQAKPKETSSGGQMDPNNKDPGDGNKKVPNPNGRNGTPEHQNDVAANNTQATGDLAPAQVGNRVPDGVGQTGQTATVRGQTVDPGPEGRVIVESDKVNQNGQINSAGRAQVRDIRAADPKATIVVTDHTKPGSAPIVHPPGTQPPPSGRLPQNTPTHVPAPLPDSQ